MSTSLALPPNAAPQLDRGHGQGGSGGGGGGVRPPSPLRNGFVPDTSTGIDPYADGDSSDDEDGHNNWKMRSPSPSSSVSQLASNLAQGVRSFVSGMSSSSSVPRSPGPYGASMSSLPSDAELEAEAERERERTRREAERILSREAQERKMVEDRVLDMIENTKGLPPPPSRAQTMPGPQANPPSPSGSQKESWWQAAKNKLTPTKGGDRELTPAQQVIQDTKAREKEKKKNPPNGGKRDSAGAGWFAQNPETYTEPAFIDRSNPSPQQFTTPPRRPGMTSSGSPSSPTPLPRSHLPPNLTPSPSQAMGGSAMAGAAGSPSTREPLPMYAQFDQHGTLDVHSTLLTIAKRFEKLENWTVGHVRALEERMGDVERWLVEKEQEKEATSAAATGQSEDGGGGMRSTDAHAGHSAIVDHSVKREVADLREEMNELQSRMGEIGREMARMATRPFNLSAGPSTRSAEIVHSAPRTESSFVNVEAQAQAQSEHATPQGLGSPLSPLEGSGGPTTPIRNKSTARYSTSPPMVSTSSSSKFGSTGSRRLLPYPSGDYRPPLGDYATPPDSRRVASSPGSGGLGMGSPMSPTSGTRSGTGSPEASFSSAHPLLANGGVPGSVSGLPPIATSDGSLGLGGSNIISGGGGDGMPPPPPESPSYSTASLSSTSEYHPSGPFSGRRGSESLGMKEKEKEKEKDVVGGGSPTPAAATAAATSSSSSSPAPAPAPAPAATKTSSSSSSNSLAGELPPSWHAPETWKVHSPSSRAGLGLGLGGAGGIRPGSVSPTPTPKQRKRYTVALGAPLRPPPDSDSEAEKEVVHEEPEEEGAAGGGEGDDDDEFDVEETIGKSKGRSQVQAQAQSVVKKPALKSAPPSSSSTSQTEIKVNSYRSPTPTGSSAGYASTKNLPRFRSQSTYGAGSAAALVTASSSSTSGLASASMQNLNTTKPLNIQPSRLRSKSTERLFSSSQSISGSSSSSSSSSNAIGTSGGAGGGGANTLSGREFVDPLVLRRQQDVSRAVGKLNGFGAVGGLPKTPGKRPVDELVRFFDGTKKPGKVDELVRSFDGGKK